MVEFIDGSVMAQLGVPDMRIPIQYALTYPDRVAVSEKGLGLDLISAGRLHFGKPDTSRFPSLDLAREALVRGGIMPCVLNAADEVAVEAFLNNRLGFSAIPRLIEEVMGQMGSYRTINSMDDVLEGDREARAASGASDFGHVGLTESSGDGSECKCCRKASNQVDTGPRRMVSKW